MVTSDLIREIGIELLDKIKDRRIKHKGDSNEFKNNYFGDNSDDIIAARARESEAGCIFWLVEEVITTHWRKYLKEEEYENPRIN